MGRPRAEVDIEQFKRLHALGLQDGVIAEKLNTSRSTVLRLRKEHGLAAARRKGERGPGRVREEKPYYEEACRIMSDPDIAREIYAAARELRREGKVDEATSYLATIIHPRKTPRANVLIAGHADKTNPKHVEFVTSFEKRMAESNQAGVPGPAIFELARIIKTGKRALIRTLARKAVLHAMFVGVHETVEAVVKKVGEKTIEVSQRSVSAWNIFWNNVRAKALEWAPVKEVRKPNPLKWLKRIRCGEPAALRRIGRRGTGGGIVDLELRRAMTAVSRC